MPFTSHNAVLLEAGLLIGAFLYGDERHDVAFPIVEAAYRGEFVGCTTTSILSEVYAALTWQGAEPPHTPTEASVALTRLVEPPSAIHALSDGLDASYLMLTLAAERRLTARRVHDARHAATALASGVTTVLTYDVSDWKSFSSAGLRVIGPPFSGF